ncbi:MAG: HAMP domain-containing sensor histidine kinase [bacterium]
MENISPILNTCYETTNYLRSVALYSHILPVAIGLLLAFFIFIKAKKSLLSKVFLMFVFSFSLWLIGDLIVWDSNNYYLVYTAWSQLDAINIIFFLFGVYFFELILQKEENDIPLWEKILFILLISPAIFITISGNSISDFNQSVCEADNNILLTNFKLAFELICVLYIGIKAVIASKKEVYVQKKKIRLTALLIILFFLIFSGTEYYSSVTGIYEINLYSLFILPVFLTGILYTIINFEVFDLKNIGTKFLVVGYLALSASQLFFVENTSDKLLTVFTIVMSVFFSYLLFRNFGKETKQREAIENLSRKLADANVKLQDVDKLKTEFLSLASHQLRSPLTAIKGYTSMLLEGSFGAITKEQKEAIDRVFESSKHLAMVVEDLLNVSKIEQGGMKYVMDPFDIRKQAYELAMDLKVTAEKKGLALTFVADSELPHIVYGDMEKIRQVLLNFIDNSVKYTEKGSIEVSVKTIIKAGKNIVRFAVKDTGMGISPETKAKLFQKFSRGEGGKINTGGSGLGLYLAKEIAAAHKGVVDVESEGMGKGSTFVLEMEEYKEAPKV